MSKEQTRDGEQHRAFRDIRDNFERLAVAMELALEQLGPEQAGGEEWHRLHRAQQAAERGAALARSQLARDQ